MVTPANVFSRGSASDKPLWSGFARVTRSSDRKSAESDKNEHSLYFQQNQRPAEQHILDRRRSLGARENSLGSAIA